MATKKAASTTKKAPVKATAAKKSTTVKSAPAKATSSSFTAHVQQSFRSLSLWRSLGAEFIGTFLLAAVIVAGQGQPIFVLFALVGLVFLLGAVSGAHFNPAITIGAWVTRRIGWLRALTYVAVQVIGAALAFVVLSSFLAGAPAVDPQAQAFGQSAPSLFSAVAFEGYKDATWYVFFAEVLGTAILGFAVASALRFGTDRVAGAFSAGLGIFVALMVAVTAAGYAGASAVINPAVAVALQAYDWSSFWPFAIYAIAPVVGGVIGFILHDVLYPRAERG